MSAKPIIDEDTIETLKSLNPDDNGEFLREIIGIFLEDIPERIKELEQSLAAQDKSKFVRAAHSIKGSSANMGAMILKDYADELETRARDKGLDGCEALITSVKEAFTEAEIAIKKIAAI
jgi:HPt (histidine-containing phosphotransfer) domain-containing protein